MKIDPNSHISSTPPAAASRAATHAAAPQVASASFEQVAQLNQALQRTPEVRAEVVAKARLLVGDVKYPPDTTIQRIARLLAMELGGSN